jgi:hypothetical protein
VTVLSFPIRFGSNVDARTFVKRVVPLLEVPCLIYENTVHVIVLMADFDAVSTWAEQFGGKVEYGSKWNFQKVIIERLG